MQSILPDIGSITTLTSAHIATFAGQGEALINAKIGKSYSLPFTSEIPLLQNLSTDIGLYYLLSRRIYGPERLNASPWPDRYKEALTILDDVAEGKIPLVDSSGSIVGARTDLAKIFSTTMNNEPTFFEGGTWADQIIDKDKIQDELDKRDLGITERLL
jgi:phage gp36-like protein